MRRMIQSATACLLVLASLTMTPLAQPEHALAADATVTICDEASFNTALAAVQGSGGGTLIISCGDPITFTGPKTITSDVTIVGNGAILDGGDSTRFFTVGEVAGRAGRLVLIGMTLRNGHRPGISSVGGAIVTSSNGTLEVIASTFINNSAGFGGAIRSTGTVTIAASTFINNSTVQHGGAIQYDGGTLAVTTSTFTGNSADGSGGAIFSVGGMLEIVASTFSNNSAGTTGGAITNAHAAAIAAITASTFSGNSANVGGAIHSSAGQMTVRSSILSVSPSGGNCSISGGTVTSLGYNLSDDTSCNLTTTGDQQGGGVTINLGTLQDNGGPTHTMLPQAGSAAIGAIPADVCLNYSTTPDQRGVSRPDGDCEIGAVELGQVPVQIIAAYNLGPVFVGEAVEIIVIASGPADTPLTYEFDCDNDDIYEISQVDDPSANCAFDASGSHIVPVRVSDGTTTATGQTTVTVLSTTPTIGLVTLDPAPSDEGDEVALTAGFSNPDPNASHSCEIDWGDGSDPVAGVVTFEDGEGVCEGSHTYLDDDDYTVMVEICNGGFCDQADTLHTVHNLPPVIEEIVVESGDLGDPVTVTVIATDPGVLDELSYAFDCDNDGNYEVGPQFDNSTVCPGNASQLTMVIGVRVSDDDGGVTEETVTLAFSQSYCANRYTGQLSLRPNGCTGSERAIVLTADAPTTFCANRYTGELRHLANGCPAGYRSHQAPGADPIPTCVNRYTSGMRVAGAAGSCTANEIPHLIPAG